jgi:chorismate-pyruvate lyase
MIDAHLSMLQSIPVAPEIDASELLKPNLDLPPFLRALLVADGTVTRLLSAYFAEDIAIGTQEQFEFDMPSPIPHLKLEAGDPAFLRRVELRGSDSGRCYAGAISLLNPASLDTELFHELIDENVGMGEVLRNSARGSYREVLDIRRESEDSVTRTYAVILAKRPAILISEKFSVASFLQD